MVEAIVAAALAGIAAAGLAATAYTATRALRLARDDGNALAFATERLEALRTGTRAGGGDAPVAADGTVFARTWTVAEGRGAPTALSVTVAWASHRAILATRVLP